MSSNSRENTLLFCLILVVLLSSLHLLMCGKSTVSKILTLAAIVISLLNLFLMYRSTRNKTDR